MRILVAGAGSVGSAWGGLLCQAGHDVTLLGRAPHLAAIRERGLAITGLWGEWLVSGLHLATEAEALADGSPFDLILVAVKSYDTSTMVAAVGELLAPGGRAVSLQNGLGNLEVLTARWGTERCLAASILVGSRIEEPGRVRITVQTADEPILLGAADPVGDGKKARDLIACFQAAGIPVCYAPDVQVAMWSKALYNCALNGLSAINRLPYGALAERRDLRAEMDLLMEEAFAVAKASSVQLPWASAAGFRSHFYADLLPPTAGHRSSMLQDLEQGRRTEILALNGEVVRRGDALGLPVEANRRITTGILALTDR